MQYYCKKTALSALIQKNMHLRTHSLLFVLFLLLCSIAHQAEKVSALKVYIDADNGLVCTEEPENPAAWHQEVMENTECTYSLDADYIAHDGRYTVGEWLFTKRDFGVAGSIAIHASIYDLQEFANYAHRHGVWHPHNDCANSWDVMLAYIFQPMSGQVGKQSRGNTLTARSNGVLIDMLCKFNGQQKYHACSSEQMHSMIYGDTQKKHKTSDSPGGGVSKKHDTKIPAKTPGPSPSPILPTQT